MGKKRKKGKRSAGRRRSLRIGVVLLVLLTIWGAAGDWFVHHPRAWIDRQPAFLSTALLPLGNHVANLTDALDWTGYDTVCEYDTAAPAGSVLFAGAPRRVSDPAPADIRILDRGEFLIGWSDSLRHPVWCAYHVPRAARFERGERPGFKKDRSTPSAPAPDAYTKTGYDRGHMVPNYAIVTRFGQNAQKKTFLMTNIAPQTPSLNRDIWRDVEHRIADLWTARYGEIWVVVGCISSRENREALSGTNVDVPTAYYQVIVAQEGMDVRALAVLVPQEVPWRSWAARHLVTIRELERLTGLDFNPDLPSFISDPLEEDLPSRLWPIRTRDIFKLFSLRFMQ